EVALASYGDAATVDRVYAIGGTDGMGDPSNQAETGALGATGQWSWSKLPSVPSPRAGSSAAVFGAHLFVFGGTQPSGDADNHILIGDLAVDGAVSKWSTSQATLPGSRRLHATLVDEAGHLHLIGGADDAGSKNDVSMTTLDASGAVGAWSQEPGFEGGRNSHCCVFRGASIYLLGGWDNGPLSD